jgi:predicted nucleotide-binding protein
MADLRPAVFIGSSSEGRDIARAVAGQLKIDAEANIWTDGLFSPTYGTLESLIKQLDNFDFAIFVLSPDDKVTVRGRRYTAPRDNALFELGLFMGRLGRDRTFIVHPEDARLKLPSDLAGITTCQYQHRDNLAAALNDACTPIIHAIRALKFHENSTNMKLSKEASMWESHS